MYVSLPSCVWLVVMGPVLRVSVVQLFAAAIVPGRMLALIFLLYTMGRSYLNPQLGPPLPLEERPKSLAPVLKEFVLGFIPPAVLIFSTLGTILLGLATPTEGAAMGAFGAFLLVIVFRRLDLAMLKDADRKSTRLNSSH